MMSLVPPCHSFPRCTIEVFCCAPTPHSVERRNLGSGHHSQLLKYYFCGGFHLPAVTFSAASTVDVAFSSESAGRTHATDCHLLERSKQKTDRDEVRRKFVLKSCTSSTSPSSSASAEHALTHTRRP
ncbi:unnamed protein product [Ectocarpus sp. 13 AM-2016]